MNDERVVLRTRSGLWLAVGVWALCLLNLVTFAVLQDWGSLVRAIPVVAFVATATWMLFASPAVIVEADAVVLVNPGRDIRIPWHAIVDVQPGFSLIVRTEQGHYRAWAAPGGSQLSGLPALQANEAVLLHTPLPDDGTFARSAFVTAESAGRSTAAVAAATIRQGWQRAQQRTGEAPRSAPVSAPVSVRWHTAWLIALGILLVVSVTAVAI